LIFPRAAAEDWAVVAETTETETLRLGADRSQGPVTALLRRPPDAFALYVLAHGAGADMRHRFLAAMADALAAQGVATLRFNFPYTEAGRRAPDRAPVLEAYVRSVCAEARSLAPDLPLFAGGKSMGGRMTSQASAKEPLDGVRGLVFLGFPLHAAKKPSTERAAHLRDVLLPMLFLQGTRDDLAELPLIREVCNAIGPHAVLREFEGADHSFAVRKSSGKTNEDVQRELAHTIAEWLRRLARLGPRS
jgi:predicted alpha/beta-hydrolase family hydrolase